MAERALTDDEDPMSDVPEGKDKATICCNVPQEDRASFAPMLHRPVELAWRRVGGTTASINSPDELPTGNAMPCIMFKNHMIKSASCRRSTYAHCTISREHVRRTKLRIYQGASR